MGNWKLPSLISSLLAAAVGAGLVLYRDVGEIQQKVSVIQKEMDKQDDRERKQLDLVSRMDERLQALEK